MRTVNTRIWVVLIAAAFFLLWCVSVGVTVAVPMQEPISGELDAVAPAETSGGVHMIGILGWSLVALGFFGVGLTAVLYNRPPRRRSRRAPRFSRPVYSSRQVRRYKPNVERRR